MKNLITKFISWLVSDVCIEIAPEHRVFLEEWRLANAHSFQSLINKTTTMSDLLDKLKAADDELHTEVLAIGTAVKDATTRVANDLAALNQKVTDGLANGTLNGADLTTEITRIQGDASTIGDNVAAIAGIDAPAAPTAPAEATDAPSTDTPQ